LIKVQQILLFSATFPEQVIGFAQEFSPSANEIKLKRDELTVAGIKQMFLDCQDESEKYDVLVKLYGLMTIGSSIIFVKVCCNCKLTLEPPTYQTPAPRHCL
jgi:ATP-dependent RNA helicase DDX19/DBP5